MLDKIRAIPERKAFAIGMTLILLCPILSYLMSLFFAFGDWTIMILGYGIAFLFISSAAEKRHSRKQS